MSEKKASEILEEINSRTDTILKYHSNIDLTQKLILSKTDFSQVILAISKIDLAISKIDLAISKVEEIFNERFQIIENQLDLIESKLNPSHPKPFMVEPFEGEVVKPKLPPGPPKSQLALEIEKLNKKEEELQNEEDEVNFIDVDNSSLKNKKDGRFNLNQERLIPVQQQILYPDGKVVYLAKVEIFNLTGKLIKQTKTNQIGKWLSSLPIGKYKVNVLKNGTSTKPKVEFEYEIDIPNSDSAIELETKK